MSDIYETVNIFPSHVKAEIACVNEGFSHLVICLDLLSRWLNCLLLFINHFLK
ncbi:MAG: hypothetical protein RMY64_06190 [Nostoc sp. DedQUE08]|uniref:hypothetical protein n=1 Tax=Nostoc sp. DedQUE08 TaxID=3075393 RepID=UPI002AD4F404|nr:hypothetical protein [Nostoc sp. DedQUE08]MDZ8065218.1 hypothetical protein [Nostoc sp. DedQUE08]